MQQPKPPVIIIGMHRSGTSMICRVLEELGLFVGWKKETNNEALFFLKLNQWILAQAGGSWDHPEPIHDLLNNPETRKAVTDYLRFSLRTPRACSYLGIPKYIRYRSILNLDFSWGWKDPRNTYTLPLWLDIFPNSYIIHVYRHGVDVANSLKTRRDKQFNASTTNFKNRKILHNFIPKRSGFSDSIRCSTIEGGFSLWESYMSEATKHVKRLGDRAISIQYEEFLSNPHDHILSICETFGLSVDLEANQSALSKTNKTRAYSYRKHPPLVLFSQEAHRRLATYGY